ncbi:IclR family transcriptional regulator [Roseobacter denitrificans]|uniref:Acetate operon repressor, putative n=1 Tax=Roseobacter denitrificans (strain ATCC 33942 / OCh 114) TaxID=375451 RepID=Q160P8_ROSDO|nr:IclR family transcriptional regulator [Roseobacter denitrificans]ABG33545.1 Acetate operon repressor, putative [Roseobacter denitrificans OCh 114]AVL52857.1 IclR family transcriptional regulator [Roseobacter denitrificans]SFG04507.1 transcriptional regulator, IclR family [Roseobacter denitrificans OCh 114]
MPDDRSPEKHGQIPTNLRLLVLLEEVARVGVPVTPSALKDTLNLPKPTLHRLFHTAEEAGFLQRDIDGRSYSPGPRLRQLAVNTVSSQRVRMLRLVILRRLAEEIGETCNISTPDREGMTYLDRVETHWPLRIQLPVGSNVPFHCTASGKMYLSALRPAYLERLLANLELDEYVPGTITDRDALKAELDLTRKRGFSTDDEEFMEGMAAVAVPIYDTQKRLVSTLSVHAPLQRQSLEDLVAKIDSLFAAASELSDLINT